MLIEKENLFIIFPPGSGGNHMANLIGLTDRFIRETDYNKYQELSNVPADNILKPAHYSPLKNLDFKDISEHFDMLIARSNVFCSHLGEYLFYKDLYRKFPNRKYLIFTLPKFRTSKTQFRMEKFNSNTVIPGYTWEEQRILYTWENISLLYAEDDFFIFDPEMLFGDPAILFDYIETTFCTKLNRPLADEVHKIWQSNNLINDDIVSNYAGLV